MKTSFHPFRFALVASLAFIASDSCPAAPSDSTTPLMSTVFEWEKLPVKTSPKGEGRAVAEKPTPTLEKFEMHVTTLNPGMESPPPHHHPQEELILLKEGTVQSSINGHTETIGRGSVLFFASHDLHNVKNIGDKPATYYVINFYTAATHTVRDQPASEWAPANTLRSSVIDWEKLTLKVGANDSRRFLLD